MEEIGEKIYSLLAEYGLKVVAAIVILVIGWWLAKFLSRLVAKSMTKANIDPTLVKFTKNHTF